ncbi:MAG: DNA gyrase subunit A [Clostridiales bacterium GWF2_36_10]|nr:MAG: DNA gyrase subunit A [Clostridiales bacterium GWF2_36_10]HAN21491.1 DNA gyrase subunit A [Clostridiales bacterium]
MAHENDFDYSSHEEQTIHNVGIEKEIKSSYLEYAMDVIVGRALPDVRDGLKPVHRRILYAMYEDKLTSDKPFRKSATTVGNVLGRYHPHGDTAVYDTMVRMAQHFSLRYPLIDGHGNFGNIDGDSAAAYRYTEARMAKLSNEMLVDIEKNVVDFMPNYDNMRKEPKVLPSRFPNLLVNGSIGIAVGMATNIPPHNLTEVINATTFLIDNPDCSIPELIPFIKGPDFPTFGTIYGTAGIYEAYMTGRGKVRVRAKAHFEEKHGKTSIIITELPYQVNRSLLLDNMVLLVKNKRIEGISDIRNESGRNGMRIVVEVKKDANVQVVLNLLYKYTQLQDTCAINMLALVNGEPKTLNLKEMLVHYIGHQKDVITRRTIFELEKAEREAHIYEGLKIAIDNIDEVIQIIRSSSNICEAKENLIARFGFTEIQAQAIVEMTLGRLSGLERKKIEDRLISLYALIEELKGILADKDKITAIIKEDLNDIKNRYGDERRTDIVEVENEILMEDLIERENSVITVTHAGYIKRLPSETYSAQRRGGKGITAMSTKEEDFVKDVIISHSHDFLLMFSNLGKMYIKKCYEIPESGRTAKGINLVNVLSLDEGEKITAIIPVTEFTEDENLVLLTKFGVIKRVSLMDYKTRRTAGLYAVTLDEGDELLYVMKTTGNEQIIAATRKGLSIRFDEQDVRVMGRQARGVRAMRLAASDYIVGSAIIPKDYVDSDIKVITITEGGYGKRCDIDEYTLQNRGGKGIICHRLSEKTGSLAGIAIVEPTDEIMLITDSGIIIRTKVDEIPIYGRSAGGVIVMRLGEDASIVGFASVKIEETASDELETEDSEEITDVDNISEEI